MKKQKTKLALISLTVISLIGLIVAQTYMIFATNQNINQDDDDKFPGYIGLRDYFDSGIGTETDPYIITRPIHMYNLARLQSLGAFPDQFYFELGKDINNDGTSLFYENNTTNDTSTFLDMSDTPIISIGSPGVPFYGNFEGNNLVIKDLTVNGEPQDIGVFGYVAPDASVADVIFDGLTITDNGYSSSVDDLFKTYDPSLNEQTSLEFDSLGTITNSSYSTQVSSDLFDGNAFTPTFPTGALDDDITYTIRSTNHYILNENIQETGTDYLTIDSDFLLNTGVGEFAESGQSNAMDLRIYLSANITVNNIVYSKILATYTLEFHHTSDDATYFTVAKDPSDYYDNYSHKTNIGFLAGHCDGSFTNSYVYNGTFSLNNSLENYTSYPSETSTGLIGESGINVNSTLSPETAYSASGDTGVINFTAIYSNVRGTQTVGTGTGTKNSGDETYNYVYFDPESTSNYNEYLRRERTVADEDPSYVTGTVNDIDFKGQQIIADTDAIDRGLGIFQLNTANYDNDTDYNNNFFFGLGEFNVTYESTNPLTEMYFSTAEFDATQDITGTAVNPSTFFADNSGTSTGITNWSPDSTDSLYRLNYGTTFPDLIDSTSSFSDGLIDNLLASNRFEKNFNYIINFDLQTANTMNYQNYFSYTDNKFIQDYFSYKLKDKYGESIEPKDPDFGVMIKDIKDSITTNVTSFDSYLKISANNGTIETMEATTTNDEGVDVTTTYPSKTIEFKVDADNGANVTVVAKSTTDSSNYVGIYDKSYIDAGSYNIGYYPSYTMYVPDYNADDETLSGMKTYFNYDISAHDITDASDTFDDPTLQDNDSDKLYAHTFFLPKGDYFLGTPEGNAYIYYIAAQGQEGTGNLSNENIIYGANVIEDLDFLLYDPTAVDFDLDNDRAYLSFAGTFTSNIGSVEIAIAGDTSPYLTITAPLDSEVDGNLDMLLIYNELNKTIDFNGDLYTDTYVAYNYGG